MAQENLFDARESLYAGEFHDEPVQVTSELDCAVPRLKRECGRPQIPEVRFEEVRGHPIGNAGIVQLAFIGASMNCFAIEAQLDVPAEFRQRLGFARVDQATWPKPRHDFGEARVGNGEATLASTEHTGVANHFLIHVPGTMHDDRP